MSKSLAVAYAVRAKKKAAQDIKVAHSVQELPAIEKALASKSEPKAKPQSLAKGGGVAAPSKISQPRMASSSAFSVRQRDMQDDETKLEGSNDAIDDVKDETQVADEHDEVGQDRQGPEVKDDAPHSASDDISDDEIEKHASIAAAIMAKNRDAKMMAEGGMVDLDSEEQANDLNDLDEAALKEDYDSDIASVSQPEDSNEHSADIEHDKHDMIAAIRRKMKSLR